MPAPKSYDRSVFVNCPFDSAYRPLFEAVVFTIYDCGFLPRCALETGDSSQVRIDKILALIRQCRLSVHDISRTELDAGNALPRFNMPFELGLSVGAKAYGTNEQRRKAAVIFDIERYRFQKFLSDIAGQDIRAHERKPRRIIQLTRDFLSEFTPSEVHLPGGTAFATRYRSFRADVAASCVELRLDPAKLTFRDLSVLIVSWIRLHPLPHHSADSG